MTRSLALLALALVACGDDPAPADDSDVVDSEPLDTDTDALDTDVVDTVVVDSGTPPVDTDGGPCPDFMVPVDDAFCIDVVEASLEEQIDGAWKVASPFLTVGDRVVRATVRPGRRPQAYISGDEAAAACAAAGKRLCTAEAWTTACRGPEALAFPYGDAHVDGACHDAYPGHPVFDFFGTSEGVFDEAHLNDPGIDQQPGTLAPGGSFPSCVSAWGAYDLHGNLNEWVDDPEGTTKGGSFADASLHGAGCSYTTTAHDASWHDYGTGFRCCADLP